MSSRYLSSVEFFKFAQLLQDEFAAKGMTDPEFAKYASEKLGFDVNKDHVGNTRRDFGIPSARAIAAATKPETIADRLGVLERKVAALEAVVFALRP